MSEHGQGQVTITLAVLTYRRPDDLLALMPLLQKQAAWSTESVEVLVVDNDPAASARDYVESLADSGVRYAHEATPGISAARNRALEECAGRRVIVFIDDDERPVDDWLRSLTELFLEKSPAGVVGPVISRYATAPDRWIEAGNFFDRRRLATGTPIDVAATNNLLLDLDVVRGFGLRFDEAFGLSGGSDTLFTRELIRRGGSLLWCDEAIVYDIVPTSRLTRDWVLQRAYRSGNSWSRVAIALSGSRKERARLRTVLTLRGALRMLGGAAQVALGAPTRSLARNARGSRTMKRGQGMIAGAWGHVYSEYKRD